MQKVSTATGKHYLWGGDCAGWHLVASPALSVIEERVPSGRSERRHFHERAEQFFYVLEGIATLEVEGVLNTLRACEGLHVPAGTRHTLSNDNAADFAFWSYRRRRVMETGSMPDGDSRLNETSPCLPRV